MMPFRHREEVCHTILQTALDGFWVVNAGGRFLDVNEAYCRLTGYSRDELQGMSLQDVEALEGPAEIAERLQRIAEMGSARFESRLKCKDGRSIEIEVSANYLCRDRMFFAFLRDITERKRAERVSLENETLYRTLFESASDAIFLYRHSAATPPGRFAAVNGVACRLLGCSREELLQLGPGDIVAPEARAAMANVRAVINTEGCADFETTILHGGVGCRVDVEVRSRRLDLAGEPMILSIARDITERRRMEKELRTIASIVESSTDMIGVASIDGQALFVNPAGQQMLGLDGDEDVRGATMLDFVLDEDRERFRGQVLPAVMRVGEWAGETRFRHWKTGAPVPMWQSVFFITEQGTSRRIALATICRDNSERKRAEDELRRAREAAEAANEAKSQFLANMSHEIRTPMNGVIGMNSLLLETNLTAEQRQYAELAHTSGETLMALIDGILDFSRIEARKLSLESLNFDLRSMLKDAVEKLAISAQGKGLALSCQVAPETPCLLSGDPARLRQILVNLITNAVKFTHRGEVAVRVGLEGMDQGTATLRFAVADTGIGIRRDRVGALFAPFVQADGSTTRKYGGTGLGLALCKQLVEMMGGQIGVETEEGKGSTFWFTAVLEKQHEPPAQPAPTCDGLDGVKVLLVDGHATSRLQLAAFLKSWGCRCCEASAADSALETLRKAAQTGDPFRVALLDRDLPGMNGEELGKRIAADQQLHGTVLLLVTSLGRHTDDSILQGLGFEGHVDKPVEESRLREVLALALGGKQHSGAKPDDRQLAQHRIARPGGEVRILVAEDDSTNREVALAMLRKFGYRADAVANGAEVILALQHLDFDVVLMDCEMPGTDGYEATRRIRDDATRARNPRVPIIAVTADATPGCRDKCAAAGMDDYLAKPIEPRELAQRLARWLGSPAGSCVGGSAGRVDTPAIFDEQSILNRVMGDRDLAGEIVAGFLADVPLQLDTLKVCSDEGDVAGIRRRAHSLKGAAATVSALALRDLALQVEQAATVGELERANELLPRLGEGFEQLKATLKQSGWA